MDLLWAVGVIVVVGWMGAALLGGVLLGEERARRRFDGALEAKFGEGAGAEDRGDETQTFEQAIGAPRPTGGTVRDEDAANAEMMAEVERGLDLDALPRSVDEDGTPVRVAWVVPDWEEEP